MGCTEWGPSLRPGKSIPQSRPSNKSCSIRTPIPRNRYKRWTHYGRSYCTPARESFLPGCSGPSAASLSQRNTSSERMSRFGTTKTLRKHARKRVFHNRQKAHWNSHKVRIFPRKVEMVPVSRLSRRIRFSIQAQTPQNREDTQTLEHKKAKHEPSNLNRGTPTRT